MEQLHIQEEYFENEAVGVETEDDVEPVIKKPWNPDDIRVNSKTFSVRNVLDMIDERGLEVAPQFQRQRVWKPHQKSRLIESILLQIPLPSFYFTEEADGLLRVVDGLQRISTVYAFTRGGATSDAWFPLSGLEYLKDVDGKRYGELAPSWQRRIHNTQLLVHVIDPQTPDTVKFDIFRRINTGGTPLNAQEIRHCMSSERSRQFLKNMVSLPSFQNATGNVLTNHIRMVDREVALRFVAFRLISSISEYGEYETMDAFLTAATRKLDVSVTDEDLLAILRDFDSAMNNSFAVFGDHAFRKWPDGVEEHNPINRALFEAWSVSLAGYPASDVKNAAGKIRGNARELMTLDQEYIEAISTSTGDPRRVYARFNRTRSAIQDGLL